MPSDVDFIYEGATKPNADIAMSVEMVNKSGARRTIDIAMRAAASYYTGERCLIVQVVSLYINNLC